MIDRTDLMNAHEVEQLRRSVAMLKRGAPAFDREDALLVLSTLSALLRADDSRRWAPGQGT